MSDIASSYQAAVHELQKLFESDTLKKVLAHQNVTEHFILKEPFGMGDFGST